MKRYLIPILMILMLAMGLGGCSTATEPTKTQPDTPILGSDEACALVYNYLENKVGLVSVIPYRMNLLDILGKARPHFQAVYQGNGKWQVSAIGYGVDINLDEYIETLKPEDRQKVEAVSTTEREQWVKSNEQWFLEHHFPSSPWSVEGVYTVYHYTGGIWSFYEASGVIEPANGEASELLRYIQYWTR